MRITVKLFAILRERIGKAEMSLNLADGGTVADIEKAIVAMGDVSALLSRAAFAVNQEYVGRSTILKDGDEVAIIPPVSGG